MFFEFKKTKIEGLILIKNKKIEDHRGFFYESYNKEIFTKNGINNNFIQDNFSFSNQNTIRGLHMQKNEFSQAKLIKCVEGEILDIAVDLRKNSETFGQSEEFILSKKNNNQLFLPRGFAHGFLVLSKNAIVSYKVDNKYSKKNEITIIWNDQDLNINWQTEKPILSEKDKNGISLKQYKTQI